MSETKKYEKSTSKNLFKNKWFVISSVSVTVVIAIVITALALRNRQTEVKIDSQKTSDSSSLPLQSLSVEDKNNAQLALADFNTKPFDPETEKPSDRFILFKIRQGQKYRMTVNYSNIGDESMKKGSVTIKLGEGLSLVKNSMKEEISGKEIVAINDTNLYDPNKNVITYGPGSIDKNFNQVLAGDSGKIIFDVEMSSTKKVGDISRIYSYLSDEGDSKGKIDLVFFEVTPKN
jgi:hypothetical protein